MQTTGMTNGPNLRSLALGGVAALSLALAGCVGDEDLTPRNEAAANVNTPAQIAQESATNYDDNVNGLITGKTLKRWMSDWANERPAGVTGKLVILQNTFGTSQLMDADDPEQGFAFNYRYIKPDGEDVFTYQVPNSELVQTRSNGVTVTVSMVPDGPTMDAFLTKYDIDPVNDMIVCAMGGPNESTSLAQAPGLAMNQGRCWYMFRYWGVDKRNLALLNGSNQYQVLSGQMDASHFSGTASVPPDNGTASVRDLPVDNTALQATISDMLRVLSAPAGRTPGAMIWDARSLGQYSAGEMLESWDGGNWNNFADPTCKAADEPRCAPTAEFDYTSTFQNAGARQGHPHGTLQLEYRNMLVMDEGVASVRYKPKGALAAYLTGAADDAGRGFVDSTYQLVGAGQAYREGDVIYGYCETTFRAMITGMVTAVILGKPTRFYDGAMTEWNSLSNIVTREGTPILPADSPWRTDLADRSFFRPALDPAKIGPRVIDDAYAYSTNAIVNADRAYKLGDDGASGGGPIAPPANPCGG